MVWFQILWFGLVWFGFGSVRFWISWFINFNWCGSVYKFNGLKVYRFKIIRKNSPLDSNFQLLILNPSVNLLNFIYISFMITKFMISIISKFMISMINIFTITMMNKFYDDFLTQFYHKYADQYLSKVVWLGLVLLWFTKNWFGLVLKFP